MRDWNTIAANYRQMTGDVLHPDECVVIRIKGAEWRVRPLQLPRGIRFIPEFGESLRFRQVVDPLGNKPMQDRAAELVAFVKSVQDDPFAKITAACAYLSELLDQQYDLSAEVKADLLSFRGDTPPAWMQQVIRHANGLSPAPTDAEFIEAMLPDVKEPVASKPWWKFW